MPVCFDTTALSVLLNPKARVAADPATGKVPQLAKERVAELVSRLQKDKQIIVIPTPVTAEILTVLGPTNADYLRVVNKARVFDVRPFDEVAAIERAFINRDIFGTQDRQNRTEQWQKVKIDRQILAICRVAQCETLYTDDNGLTNRAKLCGIETVRTSELPIPDSARQGNLELDTHDELPTAEDDDDASTGK